MKHTIKLKYRNIAIVFLVFLIILLLVLNRNSIIDNFSATNQDKKKGF